MNPTRSASPSRKRAGGDGAARSADSPKARSAQQAAAKSVLNDAMLGRFALRAESYDKGNRFFAEDFEELRSAKYLLMPVPVEFGGGDMTLAEVCREQRRLAYHAPATALALNMHLYWTGVA